MPGSTTNAAFSEYIYFDGKRAARRDYQSNVFYYFSDQVGSARGMFEVLAGSHTASPPCFDADFYPFGGEHDFLNSCPQNYKFMGKERDPETNNDDFGARSYASAYGRFLSADWSSTPTPVPYANLTNPQTLNLYAMVSDNPESFADLDGHMSQPAQVWNDCPTGICPEETPPAPETVVTPTTEEVNKVAEPLIESAVEDAGAILSKALGAAAGVAVFLLTPTPLNANEKQMLDNANHQGQDQKSDPAPSTSGGAARNGGNDRDRMRQGKPPIGDDGHPVELHHPNQAPGKPVEMTRSQHRLGENYKAKHPQGNKERSRIDRNEAAKQRREYWKQRAKDLGDQ